MLDQLSAATLKPHVGESFKLTDVGEEMELRLIEVAALGEAKRAGGAFSLLFCGPENPVLEQGTYAMSNEGLGQLEIFLVPVGPGEDGLLYEAVFA